MARVRIARTQIVLPTTPDLTIRSFTGGGFGANIPTRLPASSGSTTYYLSPSGNDTTGTGTVGNPWRTPKKALTTIASGTGAVVRMAAGDYPSPYSVTRLGSATDPITFMPDTGAWGQVRWLWALRPTSCRYIRFIGIEFFHDGGVRTTATATFNPSLSPTELYVADASIFPTSTADGALNPGVRNGGVGNLTYPGSEWAGKNIFTYTGVDVGGGRLTGVSGWNTGTSTVYPIGSKVVFGGIGANMDNSQDLEFFFCDFHHAAESILYGAAAQRIHYVNCRVHDCGTRGDPRHAYDHGAYMSGTSFLFVNTLFYDNDATAIQLYPNGSGSMLLNCVMDGGGLLHATGIASIIAQSVDNHRVVNCLVTNNGGTGANFNSGAGHILKNTIFYGNDNADIGASTGLTYTAHANNGQNPNYVNRAAKNFAVQAGSPALGQGDAAWAPQFDFNNTVRSAADIGAFTA